MPIYHYTARDAKGQPVQGSEEAASEYVLVGILQSRGLMITKIYSPEALTTYQKNRKSKKHRKVKTDDLVFFVGQIAALLESGVPLLRAIDMIQSLSESQNLSKVMAEISFDIKAGSTLKDSVARHPKYFPAYWAVLIEAGESSGTLPLILGELAKNLEADAALKKKIVSALIYPAILICGSITAILVFMLKVIPIFKKLFDSFKADLPPMTRLIMSLSALIQHYILYFLIASAVGIYLLRVYVSTPNGRRAWHRTLLNLPIFNVAVNDIIHARLTMTLSTLTKSGLNLLKCIEITARATGNVIFESALQNVSHDIQQGQTLAASMQKYPVFSPMMIQLIMVGEESGKLPEMIEKASKYFRDRVDVFAARVGVLIEPVILVLVGAIVGVIVIAMFLPIFSLSTAIK